MRIKVIAVIATMMAIALGLIPVAPTVLRSANAAELPEMCNGRSDPNLEVVAQANGPSVPGYFLAITTDASGRGSGTLIFNVGAQRLVVTDWCRVWQHIPGQPSNGNCGMTYPEGAITAHAVGEAKLDGEALLVRTDVRQLASGAMLFRVRYRPLAAEESTTGDDCETGWTKYPSEGWYSLDSLKVQTPANPVSYLLAGADGGVFTFGSAAFYGSLAGRHLNAPVVGMVEDPVSGGYWLVAADGGVFAFGGAAFYGSLAGRNLNAPVVGMASTPTGDGYSLVAAGGGVFAFGGAAFYGSLAGMHLNAPVVGMIPTPSGDGYWLVAADGGVFNRGAAPFRGSTASTALNGPVVGMDSFL